MYIPIMIKKITIILYIRIIGWNSWTLNLMNQLIKIK